MTSVVTVKAHCTNDKCVAVYRDDGINNDVTYLSDGEQIEFYLYDLRFISAREISKLDAIMQDVKNE